MRTFPWDSWEFVDLSIIGFGRIGDWSGKESKNVRSTEIDYKHGAGKTNHRRYISSELRAEGEIVKHNYFVPSDPSLTQISVLKANISFRVALHSFISKPSIRPPFFLYTKPPINKSLLPSFQPTLKSYPHRHYQSHNLRLNLKQRHHTSAQTIPLPVDYFRTFELLSVQKITTH